MIPQVLKNLNAFVDGRGYAGKCTQLTPPELSLNTEEYRGGGMDGVMEMDMGMEAMEAAVQIPELDADLAGGFGRILPMTFRGAFEDERGEVTAVVIALRGKFKGLDMGDWEPGQRAEINHTMAVHYYRLEIGGSTVHEIDIENMTRVINGTDQLAAQRAALGI
ncbi:MAG: phage major tail tube protein [Opitutales bacterium]|nr:phage major tail tube protein [Opitutales bacterium]